MYSIFYSINFTYPPNFQYQNMVIKYFRFIIMADYNPIYDETMYFRDRFFKTTKE